MKGAEFATQRDMTEFADTLSHSRLFYGMPPASLADLITCSRTEIIPAKMKESRLIPMNELRVILQGDLRIVGDGTVLGRGNFLGEAALLAFALPSFGGEFEGIRVRSQTGCTCLVITQHVLVAWMERHPQLQTALYQHLSQELFNRSIRRAA